MARIRLTAGRIASATCPDGKTQAFVWDDAAPGLALRVTAAGDKAFIFQSRLNGAYTPEEIGRIHSLPRFEITALAQDIPKELLSLPPCSEVVLRSSSSDDVITVENAIRKFRHIISPPDRLTVSEAAKLLERYGIQPPPTGKTHGPFRIDPLQWLCSEVEAGRLVFHDHSGLTIKPGEYAGHFGLYGETTSRKELNAWLERIGHLHRIPESVAPSVAVAAPTPAPSASASAMAAPEPVAPPAEPVPDADRPPTVQQAIAPYVAKLMQERPNYTAEDLYQRMRRDAGGDDSPFSRLEPGGELFSVDAGNNCGISSVRRAHTDCRKTLYRRRSSTVEVPSNP